MPHHSGAELPGAQALRQMAAQSDSRGLFSDRAPDPAYAGLFLNRELSWLQFNRRVLAEAADETLPGYERLKFLSIYCSNLDEFYMVRVGGLLDRALLQPWHTETITGLTPREQLRAIYDETARQQKDFEALWRKVTAALAKQHVEILDFDRLDEADEVLLRRRFDALRPLLSPQVLDAEHPLPFLRNREQYVLVRFAGKRGGAGLVPTTQLPKFFKLTVDGVQKLALTAPLVAHFAPLLFGERRVRETAIVRVTRSADISVRDIMDGCDADLRAVMERLLRRRRRLEPVRAQVQGRVSDEMRALARELLGADMCSTSCSSGEMRALARELLGLPKRQLFVTSAPADLSFVLTMPGEFDLAGLTCPEIPPAKNVALQKGDYFAYLAQHDLLLALPYQSINPFVDLLYEAADDPDVVSIKITLYRLAGSSRIAAALAYAAEHGKQVQCLLELRARFDEQSNIDYSRMLEDAGCGILYGLTKYKVHTKLCLITRRCPGGICYYTQVGTGNYNEKTAEQYTDLMLLTSDPAIGRDAAKTFDRLARGETVGETEALWLAPEGYKPQLMAHIEAQTRLGPEGYIGIKVNSMNDADVMARLVRASEAGTEVELFVRGICCLRPGVPGRTEHISVRSIIGRYLEHERIFVFGRGEAQEVFIGSGDLLERNTMRRIEAFTAVTDPNARAEVLEVLSAMRRDNRQAWIMQPDGSYIRPEGAGEPFVSQAYLHTYFAGRTVEKPAPPAPPQPRKKLPWWRRLWIWLKNN